MRLLTVAWHNPNSWKPSLKLWVDLLLISWRGHRMTRASQAPAPDDDKSYLKRVMTGVRVDQALVTQEQRHRVFDSLTTAAPWVMARYKISPQPAHRSTETYRWTVKHNQSCTRAVAARPSVVVSPS